MSRLTIPVLVCLLATSSSWGVELFPDGPPDWQDIDITSSNASSYGLSVSYDEYGGEVELRFPSIFDQCSFEAASLGYYPNNERPGLGVLLVGKEIEPGLLSIRFCMDRELFKHTRLSIRFSAFDDRCRALRIKLHNLIPKTEEKALETHNKVAPPYLPKAALRLPLSKR